MVTNCLFFKYDSQLFFEAKNYVDCGLCFIALLIANAQSNELISWSSIMGGPAAIPIIAISAISNPPSPKCKSCIALGEKNGISILLA